mgnify:CR=1 FL=1
MTHIEQFQEAFSRAFKNHFGLTSGEYQKDDYKILCLLIKCKLPSTA